MELMATCLEKLLKHLHEPIPECILGKVAVAVCAPICLHCWDLLLLWLKSTTASM